MTTKLERQGDLTFFAREQQDLFSGGRNMVFFMGIVDGGRKCKRHQQKDNNHGPCGVSGVGGEFYLKNFDFIGSHRTLADHQASKDKHLSGISNISRGRGKKRSIYPFTPFAYFDHIAYGFEFFTLYLDHAQRTGGHSNIVGVIMGKLIFFMVEDSCYQGLL